MTKTMKNLALKIADISIAMILLEVALFGIFAIVHFLHQ